MDTSSLEGIKLNDFFPEISGRQLPSRHLELRLYSLVASLVLGGIALVFNHLTSTDQNAYLKYVVAGCCFAVAGGIFTWTRLKYDRWVVLVFEWGTGQCSLHASYRTEQQKRQFIKLLGPKQYAVAFNLWYGEIAYLSDTWNLVQSDGSSPQFQLFGGWNKAFLRETDNWSVLRAHVKGRPFSDLVDFKVFDLIMPTLGLAFLYDSLTESQREDLQQVMKCNVVWSGLQEVPKALDRVIDYRTRDLLRALSLVIQRYTDEKVRLENQGDTLRRAARGANARTESDVRRAVLAELANTLRLLMLSDRMVHSVEGSGFAIHILSRARALLVLEEWRHIDGGLDEDAHQKAVQEFKRISLWNHIELEKALNRYHNDAKKAQNKSDARRHARTMEKIIDEGAG